MEKLKVAIIGAGFWGKNLIRIFSDLENVILDSICDLDKNKLDVLQLNNPIKLTTNPEEIFGSLADAVLIVTPPASHYDLARRALKAGKHVWLEKPMTIKSSQAEDLIKLAATQRLTLHVDHTFLYTAAVRKIKEIVEGGELGEINYISSERLNLGLIQSDVNVVYDLAVHDLSIINYLLDSLPYQIEAGGDCFITKKQPKKVEEVAQIILRYPPNIFISIAVSWLSPLKVRTMIIGGDKKMLVYDDMQPMEKIKVFDYSVHLDNDSQKVVYKKESVFAPTLDNTEALQTEAKYFLECIREGKKSLSGGEDGFTVIKIIETINSVLNKD